MTLRQKILAAIIATNAVTFAILAGSLSLDAAARRRAEEIRHRTYIDSANRTIGERFLEVAGRALNENVLVKELLGWPVWSVMRDAIVLNTERQKEFFISPLGARYRRSGFSAKVARQLILQAIDEGRVIPSRDGLAAPLELNRPRESLLNEFTSALGDLVLAVAQDAHPMGSSAMVIGRARQFQEAAAALLEPSSRIWGGVYLEPLAPQPLEYRPLLSLRSIFLIVLAGTAAIVSVTYLLLSTLLLRPIGELEQSSRRVAAGDYSRPIPSPRRKDEIAQVVASFNAMLQEIRDYHQHLQEKIEEATERRRAAEGKLITAQRLAATGKLASGIAHEINNPLGGLINMSRSLVRKDLSEEKRRQYLELIIQGLERIQETVKKVLRFSPREVKPQLVDIRSVLDLAVGLVQHRLDQSHVALVREGPTKPTPVFGDPHELQQVFLNLLINAIDAFEGGGSDTLEPAIAIRCRSSETEVIVAVEDNGCGMSDEQRAQAFDLFYTTKAAGVGTGLGLSIVHHIVQNHGGRIELRSHPGAGTTIEITLPIAAGQPGVGR